MKIAFQFVLFMVIAILVIFMGILLGEIGGWYLAWLLGTVVIVLVSAAGGALLDTQEAQKELNHRSGGNSSSP